MTLTRSQKGITPRKTEHPGFVETPRRRRKSGHATPFPPPEKPAVTIDPSDVPEDNIKVLVETDLAKTNGHVPKKPSKPSYQPGKDAKRDYSGHVEFGGSLGVSAITVGFPALMYYMWLGATYYDGHLPLPQSNETWKEFVQHIGGLVYAGAFPTIKAWTIYWTFFIFEAACYLYLPGVTVKGKPLPHEGGKQLTYYCSGVWSFYVTIVAMVILHTTGLFKLYTLIDEFGPLMSVAIVSGFLLSVIFYVSAIYRGAEHRMTGHLIYDFFMGAELNPRIFGLLDFKMFFEVRIPWYMLLLTSCGAAARQYEQFGWVSGELMFLVMAHFLYANACAKGEEMIVTTWDMYFEKLGFMLTFWNLAGVPLSYCHCTIYLANHAPSVYRWSRPALMVFFLSYLIVYWIWDTANSQKNAFRHEERGTLLVRNTFPQLPWRHIKNPKTISTDTEDSLFVDGWYAYARKIHYTCDFYFAISWAVVTGFGSPFPWFYPVFFSIMIVHRAIRDSQKCEAKYGEAWKEYTRQVPYLFIPYVF